METVILKFKFTHNKIKYPIKKVKTTPKKVTWDFITGIICRAY